MKNEKLFISVSSPEESRKVAAKLEKEGYSKFCYYPNRPYIKTYDDNIYSSFDDECYADDHKRMTAAEFLKENPGLPEYFYVNVPTLLVAEAVKEKLISLGYRFHFTIMVGKVLVWKDKSFKFREKDYIVDYPYPITEEISLDRLFATPETPRETEIPGILAAPYTIFKKENGDFSIREHGREAALVPAANVAQIKKEVNKFLSSPSLPDSFFVRVPAPELSELVQKRLFSLVYKTSYCDKEVDRTEFPFIEVEGNIVYRNAELFNTAFPEIQIADLWKTRKSVVLPGLVPGYQVEICESGVKVGCQTISFDAIKLL